MSFRSYALTAFGAAAIGLSGGLWLKSHSPDKVPLPTQRVVGGKTTCFTPGEDCTQFIVDILQLAESEILVQAYNYTSAPILYAIGQAKTSKKLTVRVILDKSNEQPRYTGGTYMQRRDIPVLIDDRVRIAHSKVIIIDRKHVLTGSFNFTQAAQSSNAENVIFIKDDPTLAKHYVDNWMRRATLSRSMRQNKDRTATPAE